MAQDATTVLETLSRDASAAVATGAAAVVTVHGRRRFPSAGVHWHSGVVVTAAHTIRREDTITVTLPGGHAVAASVAGRDPGTDLAILSMEATDASVPQLGDATNLKVGQLAFAVGRVDGVPRVALAAIGLVGGPWRTWAGGEIEQLIRLDRELHPTLSGGPLVDPQGRVLGINTAGLSRSLAVTIPAATVGRIVQLLRDKGYVARGYLGVGFLAIPRPAHLGPAREQDPASGPRCLIVLRVEPDSPAGRAGILVGDLVTALDGRPVHDTDDVQRLLGPERVGTTVTAAVSRGGNPIEAAIRVAERPCLRA